LDSVNVGDSAVIIKVETSSELKQRLFDIGLLEGTSIKVLHESPSGNPRAYLVRGAVIAIRNKDARCISVKAVEEWE
jgi:ferrous iron transport protein A